MDPQTLVIEVEEPGGRGYQPWQRVDDLAAISADPVWRARPVRSSSTPKPAPCGSVTACAAAFPSGSCTTCVGAGLPMEVTEPGFAPWRLAAHPDGGVWVLERGSGRLARLKGYPLPSQTPATDAYAPGVFRPDPENCRAPAMTVVHDGWAGVAEPIALACHAAGGLLLMGWNTAGQAWVRRWHEATRTPGPMRLLRGAVHAYALTWLDGDRIALRMPGRVDAPAFAIDDSPAGELPALGEVFPLASDRREAPFVHRPDGVAHYPVREDAAEPLFPLALPNLARSGTAASFTTEAGQLRAQLIDSGTPATTWHRVFMEASIPPACGVVVWLAATNDPQPPAPERLDAWHPHAFGRDVRAIDPAASGPQVPHAVWEHAPSELPAHPGLAPWPPQRGLRGLFSVLVQNARTAVRSLSGRYLWVRLSLHGDGRASPEVVALRAWASRFNYAEQYLPRIYRETLFGDAAQQPGERLDSIDEGYAAGLDAGGSPEVALLLRLATGGIDVSDGAQVVVEHPGRSWLLERRRQRALLAPLARRPRHRRLPAASLAGRFSGAQPGQRGRGAHAARRPRGPRAPAHRPGQHTGRTPGLARQLGRPGF